MIIAELRKIVATLTCLLGFASTASAQTFFFDDFSGMVTEAGRDPVTWIGAFGSGPPSSDDESLRPNLFAQIAGDTADVTYTDVSVRTQFRMNRGGSGMGLAYDGMRVRTCRMALRLPKLLPEFLLVGSKKRSPSHQSAPT